MSDDSTTITEALGSGFPVHRTGVRPLRVSVIFGPDRGVSLRSSASLIRIGTGSESDLALTDSAVSRAHVELRRTAEGLRVRDLGSRNGTQLEGRRVLEAYLASGERLSLGRTRLQVDEEPEETRELAGVERFGELIGSSEPMRRAFAELRRAAMDEHPVLISGETGTGKELAARAIHAHSARREAPVKVIDCHVEPLSALGTVEPGTTLVLDEISAFPRERQGELLPLLDRTVDVRVVALTQQNLEELVRRGEFRADLLQLVSSHRILMPPLRARPEDLPALASQLIAKAAPGRTLEPGLLAMLAAHAWPGNVRELRNVLVRDLVLEDLAPRPPGAVVPYHEARDRMLTEFERHYFADALKRCANDLHRATEATGLSLASLYRLLKKSGVSVKED